jgi:hypothetical protein
VTTLPIPDPGCPGESSISDQSADLISESVIAPWAIYFTAHTSSRDIEAAAMIVAKNS